MKNKLPKMLDEDLKSNSSAYRDKAELLESRLDLLQGRQKTIMTMRIRHGASFGQIAALMNMHEATVARLIRRLQFELLKGPFIACIRRRLCLSGRHLKIARDYYLLKLPLIQIAKKNNCTLYRVRAILAELAAFKDTKNGSDCIENQAIFGFHC